MAVWNKKLNSASLTIDLGHIKHVSIKMLTTGKISKRVWNKWVKRSDKATRWGYPYCNCAKSLLPDLTQKTFEWKCRKCHCSSEWIWDWQATECQLLSYKQHIKEYV